MTAWLDDQVSNAAQLLELVTTAQTYRSVAATSMNEMSSRSHTVVTVTVGNASV